MRLDSMDLLRRTRMIPRAGTPDDGPSSLLQECRKRETWRSKIQGCLLGGAAGDALGYPVEFLPWSGIQRQYGPRGIQGYYTDPETGFAQISDDTQMTLFTANGLLCWETEAVLHGTAEAPYRFIYRAYRDWLATQTGRSKEESRASWLLDIPDLHSRRAPGGTCLSALGSRQCGTIENTINDSKGCGGVMRAAPVGLFFGPAPDSKDREALDRIGAEAAAITHGHSLGYIPAAVLAHIVNMAVYGGCPRGDTLKDAVEDAMDAAEKLFSKDPH